MNNLNPPATLDGQAVKVIDRSTQPQRMDHGSSWPTGSKGVCFAFKMTDPPPNQMGVFATAGGSENFWGYAVNPDFDAPESIVWHSGANCNNCPAVGQFVLARNMDVHGKSPTFPPKHVPTSNTETSSKAYHAT